MQGWKPPKDRFPEKRGSRRFRRGQLIAAVVGGAVLLFGLINLVRYGIDFLNVRRTSGELQNVYHYYTETDMPQTETASAETTVTDTPEPVSASPAQTALSTVAPMPTAFLMNTTVPGGYPGNPELKISSRFKPLLQKNRYIVGWLTVNTLLDEAVVQKDNTFYLTHDTNGNENVNGAIFLEASIPLKTRPRTYFLYGHNMKTGAMFGSLRYFENRSYYIANPFITFDTIYEAGRFVVFAVANISIAAYDRNYVDFHDLRADRPEARQSALNALLSASVYTCPLDVNVDDQLLLLVTCTEKDKNRRVIAARRIRDGEDERDLMKLLERTVKR